jgi:hypothetical protein
MLAVAGLSEEPLSESCLEELLDFPLDFPAPSLCGKPILFAEPPISPSDHRDSRVRGSDQRVRQSTTYTIPSKFETACRERFDACMIKMFSHE